MHGDKHRRIGKLLFVNTTLNKRNKTTADGNIKLQGKKICFFVFILYKSS
jgi:hypothetical protein